MKFNLAVFVVALFMLGYGWSTFNPVMMVLAIVLLWLLWRNLRPNNRVPAILGGPSGVVIDAK
jgi:ABC-type polysaccharide/polyol phosphate export permease